jgi:biopolymer transport protein TolQ
MTAFPALFPLLAAAPPQTRLDPLELFLMADVVVQAVMVGLIVASIVVWAIIVAFTVRMRRARAQSADFERNFWDMHEAERMKQRRTGRETPSGRVAQAALREWQRSADAGVTDADGVRQRLAAAMDGQVAIEADELSERLNFLATVGAVAPFVGLFGTVWGIMNSFFQIGAQESSSLAVVAPGIAEALFATAIGLFAAIPAVIAYNRFSHDVNRFEARLKRFADRFHASLSRQLEKV